MTRRSDPNPNYWEQYGPFQHVKHELIRCAWFAAVAPLLSKESFSKTADAALVATLQPAARACGP